MTFKHLSKKDKAHYAYSACRKPETKFETLCRTLHSVSKERKQAKIRLNGLRKSIAKQMRYSEVLSSMRSIETWHARVEYLYEVKAWLCQEYTTLVKQYPQLRNVKVRCR